MPLDKDKNYDFQTINKEEKILVKQDKHVGSQDCHVRNFNNTENNAPTIAVIGAGIIGVNCAAELQSLGFQVTLLDKSPIGNGCSMRNAGHFATEQVFPLAEKQLLWQLPKWLLDPLGPIALSPSYFFKAIPWFMQFINNMRMPLRDKNTQALKSLNEKALASYRELLAKAKMEHLLVANGSLLVFETSSLATVKSHYQRYKQAGVGVELLDRQQVLTLEPNLHEKIRYALYFTDVAHTFDPLEFCKAIADYAQKQGAHFKGFELTDIELKDIENLESIENEEKNNRKSGAKINISGFAINDKGEKSSTEETLAFDKVVIATGAWSKTLLKNLGYKLPLEVERGYSLDLVKTASAELNRPVASAERHFIMTPMAHGLRLSGTVEFAGLNKKGNMARADMLFTHAKNTLKRHAPFEPSTARADQRWLGFRPSLPDSLPVISRATQHENIFFALGHQHLGLTLGAITAKLVGQLVTEQATEVDITPFSISRFN